MMLNAFMKSARRRWYQAAAITAVLVGVPAYWAYACSVEDWGTDTCDTLGWSGLTCQCESCSGGDSGYGVCRTVTQFKCRFDPPNGNPSFDYEIKDCDSDGPCHCAGTGSGS
jgi:hypothetical protein